MRTHRRFRPFHKIFNIVKKKKLFLKNVTIAQTKLPSHVEVQNTKRSDLKHNFTLFRKGFKFVHLKNTFLKQSNAKIGDRTCTVIKYFPANKCLNRSVSSQAIIV